MIRFFIFAGVVIVIAGLLYLFLVYIPSRKKNTDTPENCRTPEGEAGIIVDGVCVPQGRPVSPPSVLPTADPTAVVLPLEFRSTKVNKTDTTSAQSPATYFNDIPLSSVSSYNVLGFPLSGILQYIHFETPFASNCDAYVWYKNALYTLRGSQTNQAGIKTCYYEYKRSVFPSTIRVNIPKPPCTVFNYYIGDALYQYKEVQTQSVAVGTPKYYCIYEKK